MNDHPPDITRLIARKRYRDTHQTNGDIIPGTHPEPDPEPVERLKNAISGYRSHIEDTDTGFKQHGTCLGLHPSMFYLEAQDQVGRRRAKAICATCPVRSECFDYALRNNEHGIWGGTTEQEREQIRRLTGAA